MENTWKLNNTFLNDSETKEETNKKLGSIGSGRSPEEENVNPLQHSWLGSAMDREPSRLQSMGSRRDSVTK